MERSRAARIARAKKGERQMEGNMVRIICSALAVALVGLIVLRRKQKADE